VSLAFAFDAVVAALVLAAAAWTIAARRVFTAIVGFVGFGLLLALVWMRIAAPDVALTEAAIGSGLTGWLLIATWARLGDGEAAEAAPGPALRLAAAAACLVVVVALAAIVLSPPIPAPTLAVLAAAPLARIGVGNPVTAVLMAYRAVDTLLEVVVLLLAVLGVWSLAPDRFWNGRPGPRRAGDPTGVAAFFARLLPPFGILVAVHLFWVGSSGPGGEFQSATVLAAMWILLLIAGIVDAPPIARRSLRLALVVGPAVFLAVGFAGVILAGSFLGYPPDHAKLLILAIELPVTLSVAVMLGLLVAGVPEREPGE
jgi:multisubunit Na+/H+ antiporter MnhB subunit